MTRKQWLLGILVCICAAPLRGQAQSTVIDARRRIDWSQAGVSGGIQTRTTVCATLGPGASASQIDNAINACASGQVVKLNAGTYTISGGLTLAKNNVTLRGAGPDQTFLIFTSGNGCMGLWTNVCVRNSGLPSSDNPGTVMNWTGGYAKGTTTLTLSSTSGLAVGNILVLDQLDDQNTDTGQVWVCQAGSVCATEGGAGGRAGRAQMQFVKVTGVSGSTVTISPGLHMPNWRADRAPQAWRIDPVRGVGIEDLSLDHAASGTGVMSGIFFGNATDSWVKNVRSMRANRNHVWLFESANVTVRDSYFYGTLNSASQSYGVETRMTSDLLIENNIFHHITAPMMTGNTSGTVYGYNYALDDYFYVAAWQQASSYFHDAGVDNVLWEGNDGPGWTADNIHGSANFGTAFRNYWSGRDNENKTAQTSPIILQSTNRYMNVVGNVLGTPGYHTNYECAPASSTTQSCGAGNVSIFTIGWSGNEGSKDSLPNDTLVKSTMVRWGNYDVVSGSTRFESSEVPSVISPFGSPVPTSTALPASLYLTARPSWFTTTWPPIGPDVNGGDIAGLNGHAFKIPARQCFERTPVSNGILTFNANNCYSATRPSPSAPTNVRVVR